MKTMKKLISLLLVICVLCPLFVGCANQDEDYKMKKKYLRQFKIEDKEPEDVIIDYDGGTYNGARIVMLDTEWHDPEEWTETIGDTTIQYYDSNRLYAYKNGKFYTLSDAYEKGKLSSEDIVFIAENFNNEITHYRDTCDIFDFSNYLRPGEIIEISESNKKYIEYGALLICIDDRLAGDYQSLIDYLGVDMISDLFIQIPYVDLHIEGAYSRYFVRLKYDTQEYTESAMKKMAKIPGVVSLELYHGRNVIAGASSQSNSLSNQFQWAEDIHLPEVWEFTKGSSLLLDKH